MFRFKILAALLLLAIAGSAQSLPLRTVTAVPSNLSETSGLIVTAPNRLWSHNDGGNAPEIYEFDTTGTLLRTISLTGTTNVDWEDMTQDAAGNFYIGDFGNNTNDRTNLVIYKLPHPDSIPGNAVTPTAIHYTYPDQFAFPPADSLLNFDMEAMVAFGDSLYLFSKNRTNPWDGYCRLYRLPQDTGIYVAELIDSFYTGPGPMTNDWVAGAALSPGGDHLVLVGYPKCWIFSCYQGADFFGGAQVLRTYSLRQMEAAAWRDSTHLYFTDELINGVFGGNLYEANMATLVATPDAYLGADTLHLGDTLQLSVPMQPGATYLWSTGATTPTVLLTQGGTYSITVTTANGCTASDTIQVALVTATEPLFPGQLGSAHPNPFTKSVRLTIAGLDQPTISVTDLLGRQWCSGALQFDGSGYWVAELGEAWPAGTYWLSLHMGGSIHNILLVKQ